MGYHGRTAAADDDRRDHLAAAVVPVGRPADARGQRPQRAAPASAEAGVAHLHEHDRQPDRQADRARRLKVDRRDRRRRPTSRVRLPVPGQPVRHRLPVGAGAPDRLRPLRRGGQRRAGQPTELVLRAVDERARRRPTGSATASRWSSSSRRSRPPTRSARSRCAAGTRQEEADRSTPQRAPSSTIKGVGAARRPGRDRAVVQAAQGDRRRPSRSRARPRRSSWRIETLERSPRRWSRPRARRVGLPDLRAGSVHRGRRRSATRFSGRYFVTVDHARDRRRRLHDAVRVPPGGDRELHDAHENGIVDRRGRRTSTTRRASAGSGCKFPHLDDEMSDWARLATPMAGKDRGMFFRPEAATRCWSRSSTATRAAPYILGALWSKDDPPPRGRRQAEREQLAVLPLALAATSCVRRHQGRRADRDRRQGRQAQDRHRLLGQEDPGQSARAATSRSRRRPARCKIDADDGGGQGDSDDDARGRRAR